MDSTMLRGFWYLALPGRGLRPGRTLARTVMGEPLLLGRRADGSVFAYVDACPHRGMPMRHGRFDGQMLHCGFHGWAFDSGTGRCTAIPSEPLDSTVDPGRFHLRGYPCREHQGNVWVFMAAPGPLPDPLPPIVTMDGFGDGAAPQIATTMRFPCSADVAASGFFDPGHPAFVHTSTWWKRNPHLRLRLKEKEFQPDGLGFSMARHPVKGGGLPYKLLGGDVHASIRIALPGIRTEGIEGRRHRAGILAAATPVGPNESDVHYCAYWTPGWLLPFKPFALWMMRDFLGQDREVAVRMAGNTAPPPPLFVGDADTQIRWYLRLKKEYLTSVAEGRAFVNPLKAQTLRWRS